jgi:pimeloyl-ACP methyl ester carboxylesterase
MSLSIESITTSPIDENLKSKAQLLEKKLLKFCNLEELYYEDIPLKSNPQIYHHTLRSKFNPEKPTFILCHGHVGSSTNFISLAKYLLPRYNLFIPDTIGTALSSRPNNIKFTSSEQSINFFIDILHEFILSLNLPNKYFIGGHSLGGLFVANYSLKYPDNIEKVLLLSPAGISDVKLYGGNIHNESGCFRGILLKLFWCVKCFEPTIQNVYNNILFRPMFKLSLRKRYDVSSELNEIFSQLTEIAMEYPNDLDKSLFYVFNYPFPSGAIPAERKLLEESNLKYVICFGEIDWMDQCGSRRLEEKCPQRFKVYTISKKGHRFALENPKETFDVILQNF